MTFECIPFSLHMTDDWEKATNKVIADNLVEKIEKLLDGKATRSTVVNSRGEVKHRIIIEYD